MVGNNTSTGTIPIVAGGNQPYQYLTNSALSDNGTSYVLTGRSLIVSGSLITTSGITGSLFGTASQAISSSYALTASYLSGYVSPFPYTGSAIISGSLTVIGTNVVSGSVFITGSKTIVGNNTITGSLLVSGSSNLLGNSTITGSLIVSGSSISGGSNSTDYLILSPNTTAGTGSSFVLDNNGLNYGGGTSLPLTPYIDGRTINDPSNNLTSFYSGLTTNFITSSGNQNTYGLIVNNSIGSANTVNSGYTSYGVSVGVGILPGASGSRGNVKGAQIGVNNVSATATISNAAALLLYVAGSNITNKTNLVLGASNIPSGIWSIYDSSGLSSTLSGNLLIRTTTDNGNTLQVNGTSYFSGNVTTNGGLISYSSVEARNGTNIYLWNTGTTDYGYLNFNSGLISISRDTSVNGNIYISGNETVVGNLTVTGSIIGSVTSASFATTAATASYAVATPTVGFGIGVSSNYTSTVGSSIVGANNMFTLSTGSFTSAFFKYTVSNGSNARSGEIMAVWNGVNTSYTEYSTTDIGSTTAVTGSVSIVTSQVQFNIQTNSSGWKLKSLATLL